MELIFSLIILFTLTKHRRGFSHIDFAHCYSVFFYSDNENMEVYINGEYTGVKAPGMLYFPHGTSDIFVEYKMNNISFFAKKVYLQGEKSLVMGQITPVINLLA